MAKLCFVCVGNRTGLLPSPAPATAAGLRDLKDVWNDVRHENLGEGNQCKSKDIII